MRAVTPQEIRREACYGRVGANGAGPTLTFSAPFARDAHVGIFAAHVGFVGRFFLPPSGEIRGGAFSGARLLTGANLKNRRKSTLPRLGW